MKLRWEPASRLPRPPLWAAALVGAWLLLVLAGVALERAGSPALDTCLVHRLSGRPCPTCGSTRVVLALASGDWRAALRLNPLVAFGLGAGLAWTGARLATGRALVADLGRRQRAALLALGLLLLAANWLWVLRQG